MGILKEISYDGTMLDLIENILSNIRFYLKNRQELKDIGYSNSELIDYMKSLMEVKDLYAINRVPPWFKNKKASYFLSSQFPYIKPNLDFCFSFRDYVDVLLRSKGYPFNYSPTDGEICKVTIKTAEIVSNSAIKITFEEIDECAILRKYQWERGRFVEAVSC